MQFLLFDSGNGDDDRILIFATDQAVKLLSNSGEWYCDGTFSVCPHMFFQLYTIHVRNNSNTIPCIFGLLPSKARTAYKRFFSEIQNDVLDTGNEPNAVLCDFELTAINSASVIFPNAELGLVSFICVPASGKKDSIAEPAGTG